MDEAKHFQASSFKRSVGTTAAYSLIAAALNSVNGLIIARLLGPTGKGDFAAVSAYFGLTILIFEVGIGSSVVYFVSKNHDSRANLVRTAAVMLLPLGISAAILAETVGFSLPASMSSRSSAFMVLPLAILTSFAGASPTSALQSLDLRRWNRIRLGQPAMFLILTVSFSLRTTLTVTLVVNLLSVSLFLQTLWTWYVSNRQHSGHGRLDKEFVLPMLRFGAINMASSAPNALNSRVDQLILAVMVPAAELGQYSVAVSLSILATPLVSAFGYVAFPSLARGERIRDTIKWVTRGSLMLSITICAATAAVGPWLVPLVLGPAYDMVVKLLLILAPGAAVVAVNQVLGDVLRGLGRPGIVALCEWAGLVCTVIGLVLLVPRWGAVGAAITSTVTYMFVFALLRVAVVRQAALHPLLPAPDSKL
jgi:antigen flippase